ncbi:GTPase MTG2, mitochondrial [Ophiocordyceps camponoti-floridani]|uniref:GTPase MTG2, mitochondrial n=1 Tax=Ophiocordyceps camponoti-floridani TaxID=2030778 RepID=A0A8H4QAZ3_9HYPO|nr:GTPase MTG2, mitochondrial [Ophiocordyceps camponoti-floridani]
MASRCTSTASCPLSVLLRPSIRRPIRSALGLVPSRHRPSSSTSSPETPEVNGLPESRLNPRPDDYKAPAFADKAELVLSAGRGGHGCISFLREAFNPDGPANGGDGGHGGSIYIQAAHGETSLHKLARQRHIRASRGKNGQGASKTGTRGDDIVITVPVGTLVREIHRRDPEAEETLRFREWRAIKKKKAREQREAEALNKLADEQDADEDGFDQDPIDEEAIYDSEGGDPQADGPSRRSTRRRIEEDEEEESIEYRNPHRHKWLLHPGMSKAEARKAPVPPLPRRLRRLQQPPAPITLDLSQPSVKPFLLAAGGIGGLGNPHFVSRDYPRPLFATKGDDAISMTISLELKLLADVGLVGLPNAGKSTLLRAISNSRTRVGAWAFTTLQPNIGTVVLDRYSGRPIFRPRSSDPNAEARTRFTVADIPGLVQGAHLDRGLGIAFLRHVERAGLLAFVVDLSAGNAVQALDALWSEVALYAQMRSDEDRRRREADGPVDSGIVPHISGATINLMDVVDQIPAPLDAPSPAADVAAKPWFVVATKADLPDTQANFAELKAYLDAITAGKAPHPSRLEGAWTAKCAAIPVSAINGQGVDRIVHWTVTLLED